MRIDPHPPKLAEARSFRLRFSAEGNKKWNHARATARSVEEIKAVKAAYLSGGSAAAEALYKPIGEATATSDAGLAASMVTAEQAEMEADGGAEAEAARGSTETEGRSRRSSLRHVGYPLPVAMADETQYTVYQSAGGQRRIKVGKQGKWITLEQGCDGAADVQRHIPQRLTTEMTMLLDDPERRLRINVSQGDPPPTYLTSLYSPDNVALSCVSPACPTRACVPTKG